VVWSEALDLHRPLRRQASHLGVALGIDGGGRSHPLLALALASSLLGAGSALALDLTGTWEGKGVCLRLNDDDNVEAKLKGEATVLITQSGSDLNVTFLATSSSRV